MIDLARRDYPRLRFEVGSMTDLPFADASVTGLLAWWSLFHIPDHEVPAVFGHFRRVLRLGGVLLLGFHVGDESRLKTRGYGEGDNFHAWGLRSLAVWALGERGYVRGSGVRAGR